MTQHGRITRAGRAISVAVLVALAGLLAACGSAPASTQAGSGQSSDGKGAQQATQTSAAEELSGCLKSAGVEFSLVEGDGDSIGAVSPEGASKDEREALASALEACRPATAKSTLGEDEEARIAEEHMQIVVGCIEDRGIDVEVKWSEDRSSADLLTPGLDQTSERYQEALNPCSAKGLEWERGERKRLGAGD